MAEIEALNLLLNFLDNKPIKSTLDAKDEASRVWQYWFRTIMKDGYDAISIDDIANIIIEYYTLAKILKWKTKYGFEFSDENRCAKKIKDEDGIMTDYCWILPDIDAVNKGIYCWRLTANHTKDGSNGGWILYGVCPPNPELEDDDVEQDGVWGITYDNHWYRSPMNFEAIARDRGYSKCSHLYQKKMDVDILLDLDQQILKIGIVGQIDDEHEYKFTGIEKANEYGGWIPFFNLYTDNYNDDAKGNTVGCELRIAEISTDLYGLDCDDTIFDY